MKRNVFCALVAMSLATAGSVFAQGDGDEQARERGMRQLERQQGVPRSNPQPAPRTYQPPTQPSYQPPAQRGYQQPPAQQHGYQQPGPREYQQPSPRAYQPPMQRGYVAPAPRVYERGDRQFGGRGFGPDHRYYRGDRLPPQYRGRSYVVDNWRHHRLSPPPRGYHWVQYGGDYVLVAISTGIILQMILAN